MQSKNEMFTTLDAVLFGKPGDPLRLSYPTAHPLTGELEEQMTALIREYVARANTCHPTPQRKPELTMTPA
jgi:hypothetical protein